MSQNSAPETQWPPRTPHEALLSTPGGRDRLRRLAEDGSLSPSPIKRITTPSRQARTMDHRRPGTVLGDSDNDTDGDDEETLQLQLQEIQARLKLKKLQKAKARENADLDAEKIVAQSGSDRLSRASSKTNLPGFPQETSRIQEPKAEKPDSTATIHVPVSPIRRVHSTDVQRSPGRVLLGIDKGLKGGDVSLRRAPCLRKASEDNQPDVRRAGGFLQRANSQSSNYESVSARQPRIPEEESKLKTFNERMADYRSQETSRAEKDARLKRIRSKAFDINHKEMEGYKAAAETLPEVGLPTPHFNREQVLSGYNNPSGCLLQRSKSTSNITPTTGLQSSDSRPLATCLTTSMPQPSLQSQKKPLVEKLQSEPSEFESFSSLHLSKRILPHTILTRTLAGKKIFTVPDLLKVVVPPLYRLPDAEEDIVLLSIIASKSEPKQHKTKVANEERSKYMVMTLTDLKWELDLFLFGSGFDRFWKLTTGTVIAILNPNIMPPKGTSSGRFSLTLTSSDDTVLEIGTARDLGFCKSVKKDGKTCDSWVDKRHTEYCEFHVNESLKKTRAGRMEVNTMNFGKKSGGSFGGGRYNSRDVMGYEKPKKDAPKYDLETHTRIYIGKSARSSANLIDDMEVDSDAFQRGLSKEDRMRRRLATVEKEKEIARKLGSIGGGLGADYMRIRDNPYPPLTKEIDQAVNHQDSGRLELLEGNAKEVNLSPIKRKRSGMNSQSSSTGLGWGRNLAKELGRMKDGERLEPVKKKTRFVTAKGIREAGRESFGGDAAQSHAETDDDDDLDIIK